MTDSTPPPTVRSRDICECAALRQQLRLADELVNAAKAIIDFAELHCGPHIVRISSWALEPFADRVRIYSEARIQAETATPDVEEQVARR
jgi:hypothetical protein